MTSLTLMITRAGQARFTAAQLDAEINLGVAAIGLTDAPFVSAPTLEALPGEFKRLASISGEQVGDNIVHLGIRDDSADTYTARGFGLFLADGTLFATYAQADRLFQKSSRATLLAAIDIAFPTGDVSELRFGNTDFLNPPATTERKGVVELATEAEALAGLDMQRVASVGIMARVLAAIEARLRASIDVLSGAIGEALDGLSARTVYGGGLVTGGGRNDTNRLLVVTAATSDEVRAGALPNVAVTPAGLAAARMLYVVESGVGYRLLSDGTHEQWGTAPVPGAEGPFTLVFPRPFANECLGVFTTVLNNAGATNGQTTIQEGSITPAAANLFVQNHQATTNDATGYRWRAWGR